MDDRSALRRTIKMLELELADERAGTGERLAATIQILDEIVLRRGDPVLVAELAIKAKGVLQNGWT